MDRRDFLTKFVALSSASLIIGGCVEPKQKKRIDKKKIKDIEHDEAIAVYGPPPIIDNKDE